MSYRADKHVIDTHTHGHTDTHRDAAGNTRRPKLASGKNTRNGSQTCSKAQRARAENDSVHKQTDGQDETGILCWSRGYDFNCEPCMMGIPTWIVRYWYRLPDPEIGQKRRSIQSYVQTIPSTKIEDTMPSSYHTPTPWICPPEQ